MKTFEIDDFNIKMIYFDQFCIKKSPSGEPPTGSHLRWWACLRRPAARGLNGAEKLIKTSESHSRSGKSEKPLNLPPGCGLDPPDSSVNPAKKYFSTKKNQKNFFDQFFFYQI